MFSLYFHVGPKGSGSWVGLLGFLKLSMQETCLGGLFERLVPGLSWPTADAVGT